MGLKKGNRAKVEAERRGVQTPSRTAMKKPVGEPAKPRRKAMKREPLHLRCFCGFEGPVTLNKNGTAECPGCERAKRKTVYKRGAACWIKVSK